MLTTGWSGSYSTSTSSAASRACASVSATTKAMRSPTWRTRSLTISGWKVRWPFGAPKSGQHQQHAGRGLGLGGVNAFDFGVGVRRQHVAGVRHARQRDVVDVAALPGQEALVLDAPHRLSDPEFRHRWSSELKARRGL
jgi:hypothetical protein